MLRAVLLVVTTWMTLSFLLGLAWAAAHRLPRSRVGEEQDESVSRDGNRDLHSGSCVNSP